MPSYQVHDQCYASVESALDALAASVSGHVVNEGGDTVLISATAGAASIQVTGTVVSGTGSGWSSTWVPELTECGMMTGADAVDISWSVVGVLAVVASIMSLRKAL